jgi:RNA polymerase sigma-70 factor, ECF subfamily
MPAIGPLIAGGLGRKLGAMAATPPETTDSDEQLAAVVARQGDSDRAMLAARVAFERLYLRHAPLLLAFLASRVPTGEREDIHQDVWQRVWQHLPDQFRGGSFRAWLHQIARNALIDHARKRRPEPLENEDRLADGRSGYADARLIERERAEALRRCLSKLTAETAELVRARLGGDPYQDICPRLGLTPARAHKLFHMAKEQLQACLERALA